MTRRWALVTGAAGDLGGAVVAQLANDGWSLLLVDHPSRADAIEALVEQLGSKGTEAHGDTMDVTDADDVVAGLGQLTEGRLPAATVLSTGIQGAFRPLQDYDLEEARRVVDVNVMGTMNVLSVLGRLLVGAGRPGSVVVLSSMAGVSGAPNMGPYSTSKAALIGLVKSAAKDYAPYGIRVNAVSPAFIGPGVMWDNQVAQQAAVGSQYFATDPEEVARQMIAMVPMRRYGSPEEVADVITWLLGDTSSYVTGQNIEISGGSV